MPPYRARSNTPDAWPTMNGTEFEIMAIAETTRNMFAHVTDPSPGTRILH